MKNIKLTESCGCGPIDTEVSLDDHTADFIIRTGRGYEVRGTEQGIIGVATTDFRNPEEHFNAGDIAIGGNTDQATGAAEGAGRRAQKAI